jgi:hypothetical protein
MSKASNEVEKEMRETRNLYSGVLADKDAVVGSSTDPIRVKLIAKITDNRFYLNDQISEAELAILAQLLKENYPLVVLTLGSSLSSASFQILASSLSTNKTLTTLSFYGNNLGAEEDIILEAGSSHCTRNLAIKCRIEEALAEVAVVFSFVKANRENSIKYSILPLLPAILTMVDLQQSLKKDKEEEHGIATAAKKIKLDIPLISRFIDSRYFKALLVEASQKLEPLTILAGSASNAASAGRADKGAVPLIFSTAPNSQSIDAKPLGEASPIKAYKI